MTEDSCAKEQSERQKRIKELEAEIKTARLDYTALSDADRKSDKGLDIAQRITFARDEVHDLATVLNAMRPASSLAGDTSSEVAQSILRQAKITAEPHQKYVLDFQSEMASIDSLDKEAIDRQYCSAVESGLLTEEKAMTIFYLTRLTQKEQLKLAALLLRKDGHDFVMSHNLFVSHLDPAIMQAYGKYIAAADDNPHAVRRALLPFSSDKFRALNLLLINEAISPHGGGGQPPVYKAVTRPRSTASPVVGGEYIIPVQETPNGLVVDATPIDDGFAELKNTVQALAKQVGRIAAGSRGGQRSFRARGGRFRGRGGYRNRNAYGGTDAEEGEEEPDYRADRRRADGRAPAPERRNHHDSQPPSPAPSATKKSGF